MNFMSQLKEDMYGREACRNGLRNQCTVRTRPLLELIEHFERLDSLERCLADRGKTLRHRLNDTLHAMYADRHDSERLMLSIMDVLKPMIEERVKESEINLMYSE